MSLTAARGFAAAAAGEVVVVRSLAPAVGGAVLADGSAAAWLAERSLAVAEPQAVVLTLGAANTGTGERGKLDAMQVAAEAARVLGLRAEEVIVVSAGPDGASLPTIDIAHALRAAVTALADAAAPSPDGAALLAGGFAVGGIPDGDGGCVLTTDYPLTADEATAVLSGAPDAGPAVLLANGASGLERTAATDDAFADALARVRAKLAPAEVGAAP